MHITVDELPNTRVARRQIFTDQANDLISKIALHVAHHGQYYFADPVVLEPRFIKAQVGYAIHLLDKAEDDIGFLKADVHWFKTMLEATRLFLEASEKAKAQSEKR